VASKAEIEKGLGRSQLALRVLCDHIGKAVSAQAAADGAGGGIAGFLEVVETDFSKAIARRNAAEETALIEIDQQMKLCEIDKTTEEQDVKYEPKEAADLDEATGEVSAMPTVGPTVALEIVAVNAYFSQLKYESFEKAEPYAEKVRRRQAEIAGLKEALDILAREAVLRQHGVTRRLRGVQKHMASPCGVSIWRERMARACCALRPL